MKTIPNSDHAEAQVNGLRQQISEVFAEFPELRGAWEVAVFELLPLESASEDAAKTIVAEIFPVRKV